MTDSLIALLNGADRADFVGRTGALYERSPWIADAVWERRPFRDRPALHAAMQQVVQEAPAEAQLDLIRAHPDLAGRLARAGALDPHSAGEQQGLGLDRLPDDEFERFDQLNAAYRDRFGFPFIIAVRAQTRQSVLAAFAARLGNTAEQERQAALVEIGRIAWFRLAELA